MLLSGITVPKRLPASNRRSGKQRRAFRAAQLQACGRTSGDAVVDVVLPWASISSLRKRLTWRALRLASGALLAVVQFLHHLHRQVHIVFLELEQRGRVVHQHVGVEDVDALASGHLGIPGRTTMG
jgi:hypothetical protein